jgi:hypothetical protein
MPSTKRKVELEITQREIEALAEMLYPGIIKKPSPNSNDIAKVILNKISETYYHNRQSKLKLPKLDDIKINEDIENDDDFDEISNMSFPLRLFSLHDIIKDNDFTPNVTLNVMDIKTNERIKADFNAQNIVCIVPETKGKEKIIYQVEYPQNLPEIKSYRTNNNTKTFVNLLAKLDSLNRYLIQVSKRAIINVKYYKVDEKEKKCLQLNCYNFSEKKINQIRLTAVKDHNGLTGLEKFLFSRQYFQNRHLYLKRLIGYIEEMR